MEGTSQHMSLLPPQDKREIEREAVSDLLFRSQRMAHTDPRKAGGKNAEYK